MSDHEVMDAITKAFAPPDSDSQKEWTCISYEIQSREIDRLDDRNGGWELKLSSRASTKIVVEWRFLEKTMKRKSHWSNVIIDFFWSPFTTKISYPLDAELQDKFSQHFGK